MYTLYISKLNTYLNFIRTVVLCIIPWSIFNFFLGGSLKKMSNANRPLVFVIHRLNCIEKSISFNAAKLKSKKKRFTR